GSSFLSLRKRPTIPHMRFNRATAVEITSEISLASVDNAVNSRAHFFPKGKQLGGESRDRESRGKTHAPAICEHIQARRSSRCSGRRWRSSHRIARAERTGAQPRSRYRGRGTAAAQIARPD